MSTVDALNLGALMGMMTWKDRPRKARPRAWWEEILRKHKTGTIAVPYDYMNSKGVPLCARCGHHGSLLPNRHKGRAVAACPLCLEAVTAVWSCQPTNSD